MIGFTERDVPDQHGRCVVVTGANKGVGWEIARALAAKGARVLLGCRDAGKAEAAMDRIYARHPSVDLRFLPLNLADLSSIRVAAGLASAEPRVDVLVNNAGMLSKTLARTEQGFEAHLGTNYLGTFALTGLMLPTLAKEYGSRVVSTSSLSYHFASIDWDDLAAERGFRAMKRYAASKLALLTFSVELDRRLRAAGSPTIALACHLGFAATDILRSGTADGDFAALSARLINTPETAAWPALQAATDPAAMGGGCYGPRHLGGIRGPSGPKRIAAKARDPAAARLLWDLSVAMTGVDPLAG